jgi:hypothetical protein
MANLRHFILFVIFALLIADLSFAQCVMCKAVGEESANQGGIGSGLNKGIFFLMTVPYILLGIAAIFLWKHFNKAEE